MRTISPLIGCLALICCVASAQNDHPSGTALPIASVPPDRVSDDHATLSIHLEKSTFDRGEPIKVRFFLTAGPKGAYFPNYFGDFIATCERGFSAEILTDSSTLGDPTPRGCAASIPHSFGDTALSEFPNFVHLEPAETRTWSTSLATTDVPRGHYSVISEYLSYAYMIDEVARLEQVHGLMVKGRVTGKPVPIEIR
jgi:hypothetical protein